MKVTILINTFNERPDWLCLAIESYLANDVPKQIIVSTLETDKNLSLLKNYGDKIEIHLSDISKHPGRGVDGIYYQINNALPKIQGEWFTYFSSNDKALPDKLKNEITACESNNKLVCYSDFYEMSGDGIVGNKRIFHDYDYQRHLRGNFVSDCSLVHSSLIKKYAPFRNNEFGNYAHWDFWLRVFEGEGNVFYYMKTPTFLYRLNIDSQHLQRRNNPEQLEELKQKYQKLIQNRK